jgi:hypothetical protein
VYGWIWRKLPFGLWGKLTGSLVLITASAALLWFVVFPWATPLLPFDDVQVGDGQGGYGEQDPNAVPADTTEEDDPGLGPTSIPYPVHSNNPAPSASD